MQPKPVAAVDPNAASSSANGESSKDSRDYGSRISGAIFSIGDLFKDVGRDGHKSVKFPEKMLKVLEARLQMIAMGKDPKWVREH